MSKRQLNNGFLVSFKTSFAYLQNEGYSLKAGLRSRWLSGVEAGGGIRFDSAQRTTPKLSQLNREAQNEQASLQGVSLGQYRGAA